MAFGKKFGFGKKKSGSGFVRIGDMFKTKEEFLHPKAKKQFNATCTGEYFEPVVKVFEEAAAKGTGVRFSLTQWNDSERPVLSVAVAQEQGTKFGQKSKFIKKAKEVEAEEVDEEIEEEDSSDLD